MTNSPNNIFTSSVISNRTDRRNLLVKFAFSSGVRVIFRRRYARELSDTREQCLCSHGLERERLHKACKYHSVCCIGEALTEKVIARNCGDLPSRRSFIQLGHFFQFFSCAWKNCQKIIMGFFLSRKTFNIFLFMF